MIAEALPAALRGFWEAAPDAVCAREESFADLFAVLGDEPAQNEIRQRSPGLRHCNLLQRDATACLHCTLKENPYKGGSAELIRAAYVDRELAYEALLLHGDYDIGLLTKEDLLALTPEEVETIRIVRRQERFHAAKIQGEVIGAQLLPLLFGGKAG